MQDLLTEQTAFDTAIDVSGGDGEHICPAEHYGAGIISRLQ